MIHSITFPALKHWICSYKTVHSSITILSVNNRRIEFCVDCSLLSILCTDRKQNALLNIYVLHLKHTDYWLTSCIVIHSSCLITFDVNYLSIYFRASDEKNNISFKFLSCRRLTYLSLLSKFQWNTQALRGLNGNQYFNIMPMTLESNWSFSFSLWVSVSLICQEMLHPCWKSHSVLHCARNWIGVNERKTTKNI